LFCLLLLNLLAAPLAQAEKHDVRVLIDVSGSMKQNDPNNLRKPALRLLNGLIPTNSKAGVWTFARYVTMEVKWGQVNEAWRKRADAGAEVIHSRGLFTHIESALKRASTGWEKADDKTVRSLILLTDGEVDISKNPDESLASRQRILEQMIPQLKKTGAQVYTIALSQQADDELLKKLALETQGSYELALSAADLQKVFFRVFEKATKPDTLPLKDNQFEVDNQVKEMTLMVFRKDSSAPAGLFDPGGKKHTAMQHASNQKWRSESGYDLVTVTKPEAGKWRIEADIDPENRVMILTDLQLHVNDLPAYLLPGDGLELEMALQSKDKRIKKNSFLKFVTFEAEHDQGEAEPQVLTLSTNANDYARKGLYTAVLENLQKEGEHQLLLSAKGSTFSREKRVSFQLESPVQWLSEELQPGHYRLLLQPRTEYVKADSVVVHGWFVRPDGVKQGLEWRENDGNLAAEIYTDIEGEYRLDAEVRASNLDGVPLNIRLPPITLLGVPAEADVPVMNEADTAEGTKTDTETGQEALTESESPNWWVVGAASAALSLLVLGVLFGVLRKLAQPADVNDYFLQGNPEEAAA